MRDDHHLEPPAPAPGTAAGRLLTALTWTVLLAGLWLWADAVTGVPSHEARGTATGAVVAAGRPTAPPDVRLPPSVRPLRGAVPQRIDIPALGVQAPVVARGLDARGALDPPPYALAGVVGWYAAGTRPGAVGAALMVGHVDTTTRAAVFAGLRRMRPGETVRVFLADGRAAEFTVDDVRVLARDRFDARRAYGARRPGRAELKLITCGGTFDRASRDYTANVVVSAYLTGTPA
ncbi:class F sortase [Streptomyces sp. NPDC047000]|uniref:class F sortase n=1 Tax=Streptomyces sp. NPDC047000 TaxID=3155474 RepID=UPI0033EBD5B9